MINGKFRKILDTFRDSNNVKNHTKIDRLFNVEKTFDFNNLKLESILFDYYKLSTLEKLSELEGKHLSKILELAETDETLSLMLNEIDELTFKELGFYETDYLEDYKNQNAKIEEFIVRSKVPPSSDDILFDQDKGDIICGGDGGGGNDLISGGESSEVKKILNEYYKLSISLDLSEQEEHRLDEILEQAESDGQLSFLLNEIDEITYQELGFNKTDCLEKVRLQKEKVKRYFDEKFNTTEPLFLKLVETDNGITSVKSIKKDLQGGFIKRPLARISALLIFTIGLSTLCNLFKFTEAWKYKGYDNSGNKTTQSTSAQSSALEVFYCGANNNNPATLVQHPNRGEVVFINWKSNYFGASGWTPAIRCAEVSQRFHNYQQQGALNYIVTGRMNGYPVVCAASNANERCQGRLLFTLQKGTNPDNVIKQIYDLNLDAHASPLAQEAGALLVNSFGELVLHVDSFLEVAPVNTSQCNNLFGSCY